MAEGCDEGCLGGHACVLLTVFSKCTGCKTHKTQEQGRDRGGELEGGLSINAN